MAVVTNNGVIMVNGYVVGTVKQSAYKVPNVVNVGYDRPAIYVIK